MHTVETVRLRYFMDLLMDECRFPVMLVGGSGCGKTLLIKDKLAAYESELTISANVPFNFYTTSEMLQRVLEKPLEKKAGRSFGPPGTKRLVYFVDDMNMPEVSFINNFQRRLPGLFCLSVMKKTKKPIFVRP